MATTSNAPVLIVGGGLTGLTTGYLLARAGIPCLLVEKEDRTGGLCRSFTLDGILFDLGPHVLFVDRETPAGRFTRDILSGMEVLSRRFAFSIRAGGRDWRFPNHFDFLRYPFRYKKEALAALLRRRPAPPSGPVSAEFELSEKSGPGLYDLLFKDLFLKKTLLPPSELHHHWLARVDRTIDNALEPFVPGSRLGVLRRVMKKLSETYYYPKGGLQAFVDRIREGCVEAGGEIALNCADIRLETENGRVVLAHLDGAATPVSDVVWTAPVGALNTALGESLPEPPCVSMLLIALDRKSVV